MHDATSVDLSAEFRREVLGRTTNTLGVLMLTIAVGILTFSMGLLPAERTGLGLFFAALIIGGGEVISRRGNYLWWFGSSLIVSGYALAYLVAHASFYVRGMFALDQPYACWLVELALVGAITLHANRNSLLRWIATPFSIAASLQVLWSALNSSDVFFVAGFATTVSSVACVLGTMWFVLLSFLYAQMQAHETQNKVANRLFWVSNELSFFLALATAMALPFYLATRDYAPLLWSVETPLLLAVCWRTGFVRQAFVMAMWAAAAAWMLAVHLDLQAFWCLCIPVSGLVMGLPYRWLDSSQPRWQRMAGYTAYLYGSIAVALAVPFFKMGSVEAMPYWLFEAGALLALSIWARDRILHLVALGVSVGALALYGENYQHWALWLMLSVVVGCYGMCFFYWRVTQKGGWLQTEFVLWPGQYMLKKAESRLLEFAAAGLGCAAWLTGGFFLFNNPSDSSWKTILFSNTVAWWFSGLLMIFYGLRLNRAGHRVLGVVVWVAATVKMYTVDLSGANSSIQLGLTFAAGALCFFSAAYLYFHDSGTPPSDSGGGNSK